MVFVWFLLVIMAVMGAISLFGISVYGLYMVVSKFIDFVVDEVMKHGL